MHYHSPLLWARKIHRGKMIIGNFPRSVGLTWPVNVSFSEIVWSLFFSSLHYNFSHCCLLILRFKESQTWTGRKWSTAACAFTMESLRTSTGENITTMFNMLPTVSNFEVIQNTSVPALTIWRLATGRSWPVQYFASSSATSVAPLATWLTLSGLFRMPPD